MDERIWRLHAPENSHCDIDGGNVQRADSAFTTGLQRSVGLEQVADSGIWRDRKAHAYSDTVILQTGESSEDFSRLA